MRESKSLQLEGLYPATVTPFREDFSIHLEDLRRHLTHTAGVKGVKGLVVNGGLGEILQLNDEEQALVVREAVKVVRPDQLVVAGVAGSNIRSIVASAQKVKEAGAQALLVCPPFDVRAYRRLASHVPSVQQFFECLGSEVGLPMIIFQYPQQSGCAYSMEALAALAEIPEVVAIKAATGTLDNYKPIWDELSAKLSVFAAVDSPPLVDMLNYGAHGALIGISTIGTEHWATAIQAAASGDEATLQNLFETNFRYVMDKVWENQQPKRYVSEVASTKEALRLMGQISTAVVRAPAVGMNSEVSNEIEAGLRMAGLIS